MSPARDVECLDRLRRAGEVLPPVILGACQAAGVVRLYTEDMGAPRKIDSIELINPLL